MKKIGTKQFEQKKYKTIKLSKEWAAFLGEVMLGAKMLIYGESGNGKTEFLLQLLREFANHGKVEYISYEQGHGLDLQRAMQRNKDEKWYGNVIWGDPWADLPDEFAVPLMIPGPKGILEKATPQFQDLVQQAAKRNSGDFWFIDSIQDSMMSWHEYKYLVKRFTRKNFVFISLAEGKQLKGAVAKSVKANMQVALLVKDYIAYNEKNRMGGIGEWLVWPERARERNPLYFELKEKAEKQAKRKMAKMKATTKSNHLEELAI